MANLVFERRKGLTPEQWSDLGPPFVIYGVAGEGELLEVQSALDTDAVAFREPDLGDHLTAIAYLGPARSGFDRFTLL